MSQIEISCIGSDAVFTNTPNIFSGGNVDTVKFTFDNDWNSYTTKTAVFYNNPKETALQILGSNNTATIPKTMLAQKGKLSIGVIGTNTTDDVKTSKILTYIVGKGAVTNDMETTTPTPDIWLQMLSIIENNKQLVNDAINQVDNMQVVVDESQMTNKANKDLSNVLIDSFQNKSVACINFGTYTGTGVYGESNKNSLVLTIIPRMLIVYTSSGLLPEDDPSVAGWHGGSFLWTVNQSRTVASDKSIFVEVNDKTVSWYSTENSITQCNVSASTYYYFAIG